MDGFTKSAEAYTAEIKDDFGGFRLAHSFGILPLILKKHDAKNRAMEDAKRKCTNCRMICAYAGNFVGLLSTVLVCSRFNAPKIKRKMAPRLLLRDAIFSITISYTQSLFVTTSPCPRL